MTWVTERPLTNTQFESEIPGINTSRVLLAACRSWEEAAETRTAPTHGEFTQSILEGLYDGAVDYNGNVTAMGLHDFVSKRIDPSIQVPVFKGDSHGSVILGSGFEPRVGAPIERAELDRVVAKAIGLADTYQQLQLRELGESSNRARGGLVRCSIALEDSIRWFEDVQKDLPDITRDNEWRRASETILNGQAALSDFGTGDEVFFGQVQRRIGQGGFGNVWEVTTANGGTVAMKVFHGSELHDPTKPKRFKNGYYSMSRLAHPRIVRVHQFSTAPLAFTMDYIDGPDLRSLYLDPSDAAKTIQLAYEIADAVRFAHEAGVKHRDIKPENVVVHDKDGRITPFLTDFDLAYMETNKTVTTHLVGGVINYAAPEQFYAPNSARARKATVDIFSMAQLMYFLIVGQDPSAEKRDRNLAALGESLRGWTDDRAAEQIFDIYRDSSELNPDRRTQSMDDVVKRLTRVRALIEAAETSDAVHASDFCRRVAFVYAGLGRYSTIDESVHFKSNAGTTDVEIFERGVPGQRSISIQMSLSVSHTLSLPGIKSQSDARTRINQKIDKRVKNVDGVSRHPGNSGQYQTHLHLDNLSLTTDGVVKATEVLIAALGGIEEWD
ncbi:serine/threonine protein kinase [Microbacteriaceae bacterium VKM Ac-2854]|nr:serine/threonine protein kinase [Microbacteriaceae bacterium VKM Ac-2854]